MEDLWETSIDLRETYGDLHFERSGVGTQKVLIGLGEVPREVSHRYLHRSPHRSRETYGETYGGPMGGLWGTYGRPMGDLWET